MKAILQWSKRRQVLAATAVLILLLLAVHLSLRTKLARLGTPSEPLRRGPIIESVYGIGTVTATRSFDLKLGVTNTVAKIYVKEGDPVRRGQRLIELDGATPFMAPFDGTVTFLPAKVGETVYAQSVLASVVDLLDRYILVSLEQRAALRVRQGQKARISFDSMRDQSFDGIVQAVYSNNNNFLVRIGVSDLPPQILPGMTADVAIAIAGRDNVLLAPAAAIEQGKVYVKRGHGLPQAVPVKIGAVDGALAEIVDGDVREGDRLYIRKAPGAPR